MKEYRVTINLVVAAPSASCVNRALRNVLDNGRLQEALEEAALDDDAELDVTSCTNTWAEEGAS